MAGPGRQAWLCLPTWSSVNSVCSSVIGHVLVLPSVGFDFRLLANFMPLRCLDKFISEKQISSLLWEVC